MLGRQIWSIGPTGYLDSCMKQKTFPLSSARRAKEHRENTRHKHVARSQDMTKIQSGIDACSLAT